MALREDYLGNPDEVAPAADPNISSDQMKIVQIQLVKQAAATTAGYDAEAVERRYLKALKVDSIDEIYPGMAKTGAPKDVRLQIQELKSQVAMAELQAEQARFAATLMEEQRMNSAEIVKIEAEIRQAMVDSAGDVEDRQVARLNAMLGMMKSKDEVLMKRIEVLIKAMELKREQVTDGGKKGEVGEKKSNLQRVA
jgi:hypothetical protein